MLGRVVVSPRARPPLTVPPELEAAGRAVVTELRNAGLRAIAAGFESLAGELAERGQDVVNRIGMVRDRAKGAKERRR